MKVLVVIDMQHDFVDGSLGTAEAVSIADNVRNKVQECLSDGYKIFYTKDTHYTDYLSTQEGKCLPVEHCIKGSHGWDIIDGVYVDGCVVIEKPAFGTLELPEVISSSLKQGEVIEHILLIGLCTDICVLSNAMILKAAFPEVAITVDSSCCAGVTPESHNRALEAMKACQINVE